MNFRVEHEAENSLSVKRRNDDDDGCTDKEMMETDHVSDYKAQSISKQDLPNKSRSDSDSVVGITVQETRAELRRNANSENEKNSEHFDEAGNSNDFKFVEEPVKKNEKSRWTEEIVKQLRDLRKKEAEMESISMHKVSNIFSSLRDQGISSCDSSHNREGGQGMSKSINRSVQVPSSETPKEAKDKKWINNPTKNKIRCAKSGGLEDALKANHEFFPSSKDFDLKDDELMWQNNRLYKHKAENKSTEQCDSNVEFENLVDACDSSVKSQILKTSNSELEPDRHHLVTSIKENEISNDIDGNYDDDNDNSNDDGDIDDDDDYTGSDDDDEEDDDDDDGDDDDDDDGVSDENDDEDSGDGDDDGSANSSSSDAENDENISELNSDSACHRSSSRNEDELYLAVRRAAQSVATAISDQVIF